MHNALIIRLVLGGRRQGGPTKGPTWHHHPVLLKGFGRKEDEKNKKEKNYRSSIKSTSTPRRPNKGANMAPSLCAAFELTGEILPNHNILECQHGAITVCAA